MKALIQRCKYAKVTIDGQVNGEINKGLLLFLGITHDDSQEDIDYLVKKVSQLRIFEDDNGKMNLALKDIEGELLIISQFTLYATTRKGNRPSFTDSAPPSVAVPLYEKFISDFQLLGIKKVATGQFGADMKVELLNDGPVTIMIDSKDR